MKNKRYYHTSVDIKEYNFDKVYLEELIIYKIDD